MFDPVPWMVGGGAQHSAEVGRLLGYVAANGNEGIVNPGDLKVTAQIVPDGSVNVAPGACAILCRASAQTHQTYAARNPDARPVAVSATSGAARSDLIVVRVEDPWLSGEPWADPADPAAGPYVDARVISGVPASTRTVTELNLGYSAIPLARIDIPANTGTITQAMITDLRKVANPRRQLVIDHKTSTVDDTLNSGAGVYEQFPNGVFYSVDIPSWAVVAKVSGFVEGLRLKSAGVGALRIGFNGTTSATQPTNINEAQYVTGAYDRRTYNLGGTIAIPAAFRGTTKIIEMQGTFTSGSGFLATDTLSSGLIQVYFEEAAA
jgi:hypothetical protein